MNKELGRPRSFNTEDVLDTVLKVFWKHGFQSTSLNELTSATGLSKPSLYAAFGDKKSLYLKALDRYINLLGELHASILINEPNGRQAVEGFLRSLAKMLTSPSFPGGCFIINGTADIGGASVPKEIEVALRLGSKNIETILNDRLLRAQRDGEIEKNTQIKGFCTLLCTLIAGLAVQAKGGASEGSLNLAVSATMDAWPC